MRRSSARLITVMAPAGYGKTTLLAQRFESIAVPTVWLSIGEDCADPTTLFRYLVIALSAVVPMPTALWRELDAARPRSRVMAAHLCAAVREATEPFGLILDDAHQLDDPTSVEAVRSIVASVPAGSAIALAGRHETSFPLGSARAAGDLFEIGIEDLRFDLGDAEALLRGAGAVDVTREEVAALTEQTEGWAVGLYLAARSRSGDRSGVAGSSFRGDDRYVADYVRETMLSELSPDEMDFLIRTSVLDELTGPFCDAVLETTGSGARLERLEASNLLVVPLDHRRERYRYHHLFRDVLQMELDHRSPELVAPLTARASEWCEQEGLPDLAVSYAMSGGHVDRVAELIGRYAHSAYYGGRVGVVRAWFEWVGTHAPIERYPMVAVLGAWLAVVDGRPVQAERWADAIAPVADGPPLPPEVEGPRSLVMAAMCRNGPEQMLVDSERGSTVIGPEAWRPAASVSAGLAHLLLGDVDAATSCFEEGAELAEATGIAISQAVAHSELAILALRRGEVTAAAEHASRARHIIEENGLRGYPTSTLTHAIAARVRIVQGDHIGARRCIDEAASIRAGLTYAFPALALQSRVLLTRASMALGDLSSAESLLAEAGEIVDHRPHLGSLLDEFAATRREYLELRTTSAGAPALSPAEARLLPMLTTHLSFREIGEQLFLSPHTVKTQAISIYRKLGVSSRGAAVESARQIGLLTP